MAETSLELSYPISFAELIYTSSNTPTSDNLYCSTETESSEPDFISSVPVEIIYCTEYKDPKKSVCTIGFITLKDLPDLYFCEPVRSPTIVLDSMQQNGSPSFTTENPDPSNFFTENINWLMSCIKTIASSETLPIIIATGSLGVALYYTTAGLPYLLSGSGIGTIALIASLYIDSTFINNLGVEVVKYSAMKFFAHSIEDRLINRGHFTIAPIATLAASGITTTWIILENKIIALWESDINLDRIPYTELLPAVLTKRVIQDTVTTQLPNIIELVPYVPKDLKLIKIIADFCGLFTGGVVKDTIYDYREVKNYTQAEIFGRQLFSATSKMFPGIAFFGKYSDAVLDETKALAQHTLEWSAAAISRNIGKISFESISAYFNPKQLNNTTPILSISNPKETQPTKSPICSTYQLTKPDDDNDSYSNKI